MRLNSKALGIIIVVLIFGGIFLSASMGWWQTRSKKEPARIQQGHLEEGEEHSDSHEETPSNTEEDHEPGEPLKLNELNDGQGEGQGEPASESHDEDDRTIKGKTNFRELMDWGLTQEEIETVIGHAMPNPVMTVKDFCVEQEISYGKVKQELQIMVDDLEP